MSVLTDASMALRQGVQFTVYRVGACWHSELGQDMPGRNLASAGTLKLFTLVLLIWYLFIVTVVDADAC